MDVYSTSNLAETSSANKDLKGKIVLAVDDSKDILALTKAVLTKAGAKVIVCHEPLEALEILTAGKVDLLVCDLQMPTISGPDLLVKAREAGYKGAAIAVTGLPEDQVIKSGHKFDFSCYLTKPFNFEVMQRLAYELTH